MAIPRSPSMSGRKVAVGRCRSMSFIACQPRPRMGVKPSAARDSTLMRGDRNQIFDAKRLWIEDCKQRFAPSGEGKHRRFVRSQISLCERGSQALLGEGIDTCDLVESCQLLAEIRDPLLPQL